MNVMTKIRPNTRKEEVFNMLGVHPNSTTKELADLMPHYTIDNISHAVSSMAAKNIVFATGSKREEGPSGRITTHKAYSVKYKKPTKELAPNVNPHVDLLNDLIKTLKAENDALKVENDALEEWKQGALRRYPSLDVDPLVLRAREILAAQAKEDGHTLLIDDLLKGNKDNSVAVRTVVKLLGEGK
jgi:hypothetical protein